MIFFSPAIGKMIPPTLLSPPNLDSDSGAYADAGVDADAEEMEVFKAKDAMEMLNGGDVREEFVEDEFTFNPTKNLS